MQSVWSGDRISVGARFFATVHTGPGVHPTSYKMGTGSSPWSKAARAWRWPPTPSSAEVKERVELYLYSPFGSSWPVLGWTLTLLCRVLFYFETAAFLHGDQYHCPFFSALPRSVPRSEKTVAVKAAEACSYTFTPIRVFLMRCLITHRHLCLQNRWTVLKALDVWTLMSVAWCVIAWLRNANWCLTDASLICASQRHFHYSVCETEESLTDVVRF